MLRDLLRALRWLRRNPLFTLAVTAILAVGIGANTAVFSIVDAVLLRPLPYTSAGRLVRIDETNSHARGYLFHYADYRNWAARTDLFDGLAAHVRDFVTLTGTSEPDQIIASRISPGLFSLLGVHARLGRGLLPSDEDTLSAAVLSDRLWRRRFNADTRVLGRGIALSGQAYTIVGVMPPEFEFPDSHIEMWVPLHLTPASAGPIQVVGRMNPKVSLGGVQSAMAIFARRLEQEDPQKNAGTKIAVTPWREELGQSYQRSLVLILAAVGLVLLIACADVGGLLLSRAVERQKEIAIRASLGAGFGRVLRQLLAESFVLAALGSLAGIAVAYATLQLLLKRLAALPIALPHLRRVALDERVMLFNIVLCVLLAVMFSLAPLLLARKTDLQSVLRAGHSAGVSGNSRRIFSLLIACEAGFAFLLLAGSGLMIRSLIRLEQSDKGFQPDHVLTMGVPIGTLTQPRPSGKYDTRPRQMAFYRDLLERLQPIPGIRAVAIVNNLPLSSVNTSIALRAPDGADVLNSTRTVSPQYFAAMGIPLLAGRNFSDEDRTGAPAVAIINQSLARQLFPGRDPIGQNLPQADSSNPLTVIGVVKNSWQSSYDQPVKGEIYAPYQQFIFGTFMSTIVVRTSGDPLALAATLRKEIWAVDPNEPVIKIETLEDVVADSIWRPRFSAWVFSILGALALLLTAAGVYAVVAYTVGLRARELGIRVALGAGPRRVMALVLGDAMVPLALGLGAGAAAGLLLARLLASVLYETGATDPVAFAGAAAVVLAIGALASIRPAWHAATGDPLEALRGE